MVSPHQDESIYSVPLIQYAPDSASGSQLANASFQEPSTYGSLEYPNYAHDWTTRGPGIYGGIPTANQLPRKSEFPEWEGALLPQVTIGACDVYAQNDSSLL